MTSAEQPVCRTGRVRYPDKAAAGVALNRLKKASRGERTRYWCLLCHGWHLTSQKPPRRDGN